MLTLALTYFQAPADLVDFLLPFGQQGGAPDFHFTAFRQRTRLSQRRRGLSILELGWSGRDLQISYNLKCVENSGSKSRPKWSARHFAICHTFDVENIRQTWITVKGDQLIQRRLSAATSDRGLPELRDFSSIDRAFAASLEVHLLLSEISVQNWRWYINHLGNHFEDLSRRTISDDIDVPPMTPPASPPLSPILEPTDFARPTRNLTDLSIKSVRSTLSWKRATTWKTMSSIDEKIERPETSGGLHLYTDPETEETVPLPPGMTPADLDKPPAPPGSPKLDEYGQQEFAFSDLQDIHHVDSKANEAALVIKHNRNILSQIREYYQYVTKSKDFPRAILDQCEEDLSHFYMRIKGIEMDFQIQAERIENLLKLVADRKTLV